VVEACRRYEPLSGTPCSRTCTSTLPQLLQGVYKYKQLGSIVEMQRHIRQQGSIVCRMQLYSDVKPFFAANRNGVYKGPGERLGGSLRGGRVQTAQRDVCDWGPNAGRYQQAGMTARLCRASVHVDAHGHIMEWV
jgi:hypothetical protein